MYLIMLSVKQGGIKYHFLSLWYDATWDWTLVSRTIGEHSTHLANELPTSELFVIFKKITSILLIYQLHKSLQTSMQSSLVINND